ncbi:hypothetical protein ACN47E_010013 [Coniothyrium glycines]
MRSLAFMFARIPWQTLRVSYSAEHKTSFILHHIATDPTHPLHEAQRRRQLQRPKQGLRWHVTTGSDLSKSSCVRSWARRRLRNAVKDELAQRGYDETGMLVNLKAIQGRPDLHNVLHKGESLDIAGSLRLHVQPALILASYNDVRAETGRIFDAILESIKDKVRDPRGVDKGPSSRPPLANRTPKFRKSTKQ